MPMPVHAESIRRSASLRPARVGHSPEKEDCTVTETIDMHTHPIHVGALPQLWLWLLCFAHCRCPCHWCRCGCCRFECFRRCGCRGSRVDFGRCCDDRCRRCVRYQLWWRPCSLGLSCIECNGFLIVPSLLRNMYLGSVESRASTYGAVARKNSL